MNANSSASNLPVLVFDGDCGFCRRWVERWKIQTSGKVEFRPFQEAAGAFPQVSADEFREAVYLFENGRTTRAAEAVFRVLAYGTNRLALWLYQNLPGFRHLSEFCYRFIALRRSFFSGLTRVFWGDNIQPDSYGISRKIFLKALALIYISAFASLFPQIPGLIGPDGILPVSRYLNAVSSYFGDSWQKFYAVPSLAWIGSSEVFLRGICAAGIFFSLILLTGRFARTSLLALWLLYLSLASVGQDFLSFQWDSLLLETGFLAVFWAKPGLTGRVLLQLLLFKLMFSSGLVKLASGDLAWRNLTALNFHYETQPLPGPLSWYAHQAPVWFDKICTAGMFFIELVSPFFLFFPRRVRHAGAFLLFGLQVLIFLTGNYCFFNLLTMALCLSVLDDTFWRKPVIETQARVSLAFRTVAASVAAVWILVSSFQIARIVRISPPLEQGFFCCGKNFTAL